jgi:hypothetical protein
MEMGDKPDEGRASAEEPDDGLNEGSSKPDQNLSM